MIALGYMIKDEVIMKERKHVYEIIVAERNDIDVTYNERELKFGPVLLNKRTMFLKRSGYVSIIICKQYMKR